MRGFCWLSVCLQLPSSPSSLTALAASPANAQKGYAIIIENSSGAYRGILGYLTTPDPDLEGGIFSNATFWAVDAGCEGEEAELEWIEVGWSERAEWGLQPRYKIMWQLEPYCDFTKYNIGTPSTGSTHLYTLGWCGNSCPSLWKLYIDGSPKASVVTEFVFADELQVGGEVSPGGDTEMGPSYFYGLQYQTAGGYWVYFNYHDARHCDLQYAYNGIHPGYQPYAIYTWGPDAAYPCFLTQPP